LLCIQKEKQMPRQRKSAGRQENSLVERTLESIPGVDPAGNAGQESLLTTILRAGEMLAAPQCRKEPGHLSVSHATPEGGDITAVPEDFSGLLDIVEQITCLLQNDERLAAQVAALPKAFGTGDNLRFLFYNLFPGWPRQKQLGPDGKPVLSEREVEILFYAARDLTHEEIGVRMGISVQTVHTHFRNIFKKLGVHKPMRAVARASAMGYLDWSVNELVFANIRAHARACSPFDLFCMFIGTLYPPPVESEVQPLAAFGLLLLTLSGATLRQLHGDLRPTPPERGAVCEVDARGNIVRTFGAEQMEIARSISIAPRRSRQHGFTPGNLFVAHDMHPQQGLNRAAISEFTPTGTYVRTFCGSDEVGTRMVGPLSLAFAADGRLLVSSGWLTDSILAFEANGDTVKPFAKGCYVQIGVSASGYVYGAQHGDDPMGVIHVFDGTGQLVQRLGLDLKEGVLQGLAVDSRDHIFVSHGVHFRRVIEELDPDGKSVRVLTVQGFHDGRLAVDAQNRLILPCYLSGDVKTVLPDGTIEKTIDLQGKVKPLEVMVGKDGRFWVCGSVA
jgi:DNA-binding CsgD family transcriptional regulator